MPLSRARLSSVIIAAAVGALLVGRSASADEPTKQQCVVANESAQDLQRAGRLIEARQQLLTCASNACPGAVRQDCADQLQTVGQALPTVAIIPRDAGGGDAGAATLAVDGVAQLAALDGTPIPVNPGRHLLTVILEGRPPVSLRLSLKPGDRVRREVVFKAATPVVEKDAPPAAGVVGPPEARALPSQTTVVTMRRVAWSAIGAGAAGMTLGTIFGFLALGKKSSLDSECLGRACPPAAQGDIEGLHVNGVASNVSFAIGIVGLGAGAGLLFFFPQSAEVEAPRPGSGAVVVRAWAGLGDIGVKGSFR